LLGFTVKGLKETALNLAAGLGAVAIAAIIVLGVLFLMVLVASLICQLIEGVGFWCSAVIIASVIAIVWFLISW
jgi:hypothetical protein